MNECEKSNAHALAQHDLRVCHFQHSFLVYKMLSYLAHFILHIEVYALDGRDIMAC